MDQSHERGDTGVEYKCIMAVFTRSLWTTQVGDENQFSFVVLVYAQKTENQQRKRGYTGINVETQMWEKPRQPTSCRIHYESEIQQWENTKATTSFSPSSLRSGYNEVTTSLSLSLSLSIQLHSMHIQLQKCSHKRSLP